MATGTTEAQQEQVAAAARKLSLELIAEYDTGLPVPASYGWAGGVNIWQVRPGLWRMGRNHWVTANGWAEAAADGVGTNVDLRTAAELPPRPHDPPAVADSPVQVLHKPLEDPQKPEYLNLCERESIPYPNAPKYYAPLLEWFGPRITTVLNHIAEAERGVVINCSAGRDRTGLISTLTLLLGGVSDEEILGVHAASCAGINAWHVVSNRPHPYEYGRAGKDYRDWLNQHVDQLAEFLQQARGMDFPGMLLAVGLTEENLQRLGERTTH